MKELSGDIPLSFSQKLYWLFSNALRGMWGYTTYLPSRFIFFKDISGGSSSPGRKTIDAFMRSTLLSIDGIQNASILDIGGGSGYIRKTLSSIGYKGKYTCVDVEKDRRFDGFASTDFVSDHIEQSIESFVPSQKYDLVLSITSLEHIPRDDIAVEKARLCTAPGGVQIFVFPSYWSLPLYLFHGFRQYAPRRIKRLFAHEKYSVYRLNGVFSFICHFLLITIPERLLGTKGIRHTRWYEKVVSWAYSCDRLFPFFSYTYAIVIK